MPDSQLLGILIAAMVAGVLLFRLYTVLGRRTGHEPQNQAQTPNALARTCTDNRLAPFGDKPVAVSGLFDIQLADPNFKTNNFLKGARSAYELILKSFAAGDRTALKPLLSDEVYAAFDAEIAARGGAAADESLAGITDARIAHATLTGKQAEITVAFRGQFLKGDVQRDVNDVWTFARTLGATPDWTLVATQGDLP